MKSIIFNNEMVKAILDGRKTQTRRVFSKYQLKVFDYASQVGEINSLDNLHQNDFSYIEDFSKYKVDDILYVKETFAVKENGRLLYKADYCDGFDIKYHWRTEWKPSTRLKQKDVRIFLKVTNVRVERLQEISNIDIINSGMPLEYKGVGYCFKNGGSDWWINNWNSTAKDGCKWEDNPYVFVYEFERINKED